jgi:hypothetical protein
LEDYLTGPELEALRERQTGPATVVLKTESKEVTGFLSPSFGSGEFLFLRTQFKAESRSETVAIPLENILFVRWNVRE